MITHCDSFEGINELLSREVPIADEARRPTVAVGARLICGQMKMVGLAVISRVNKT